MVQNRYLVVQLIGKGGMGEVYLAVDQRLGSAVALKRTFFREDEALGSAFEREAKILARLRHPVLPKVIDHFIEGEGQFLVMEHISGDDLSKRLESAGKPFPLSWVMFWADQLLDALNYLHSHEPPIIHRDIKPQNLKLTDDNHIVLLDFGLSKDFDTTSKSEPAGSGSVVGYSPHFASMEQVRGMGTDARSDLYSLSATVYQLLTNTIPPDALSRADALLGSAPDPLKSISEINSEVPAWVSDVVLKGIAVRQDERFTSAAEMQKALRRAFNQTKEAPNAETVMMPDGAQGAIDRIEELDTKERMKPAPDEEPKRSEFKTEILPGAPSQGRAVNRTPVEIPIVTAAAPAPAPEPAAPSPKPAPPKPVRAQAAAASGKSRTPMMIGALLGLLLLGGVAAGGGWYFYQNYYAGSTVSPTPAPTVVPSPVPSPEVAGQSNTGTTASTEETNTAETIDPAQAQTRSTPQTPKGTTPGRAQGPSAKATPKPKAKDDRTVILQ
jgi:eukaryotic-like serine/threonine-protein kinase